MSSAIVVFGCTACDANRDHGPASNAPENGEEHHQRVVTPDEERPHAAAAEGESTGEDAEIFDISELAGTLIVRPDGQRDTVHDDELGETPTLLVFWGIWCHTCHEQLAELADWHRAHPSAQVRIVAVHNDGPEFHERAALEADKGDWSFETLLPTAAQLSNWNPRGLTPTTLLVNDEGTVTDRFVGFGSAERSELFDLLTQFE